MEVYVRYQSLAVVKAFSVQKRATDGPFGDVNAPT